MNLRNVLENALFFLLFYCTSSFTQITTEVDVPELQLLASNLKPEECVRLVSLDSQSPLSDAQIQQLAQEQSCFRRLVKWICQLRTVTKNTYPILNDLLDRIGRRDLIACLAEFSMKSSNSPKVIREVHPTNDSEEEEVTTPVSQQTSTAKDVKPGTHKTNQTISSISGYTMKVSLGTAGIVLITTILFTCCCTLFIRNRIANLLNKIFGRNKKNKKKKKRGKYIAIDTDDAEDVSRSYYVRHSRAKRKRAPSYELVDTGTQNTINVVPKEPEEPSLTGCYKCYKKKRKKSAKRPHR